MVNIIEKNYKWSGALDKRKSTNRIVLHHAEAKSCTADDIHRWHLANGWSGIGYHFFVRKDGTIYRGRPEDTIGAHAYGANSDSIGVCFEGNYMVESMPSKQVQAGYFLVQYLKGKYHTDNVIPHKSVGSTDCPGEFFPFRMIADGKDLELPAEEKKISVSVRQLSENSRGNDVVAMQGILNANGYDCGKADGIFGSKTVSALKKYQKAHKLSADGICGKDTWSKLMGVSA